MRNIIKHLYREFISPFTGIVRLREVPFETEEEFKKWWLPERDNAGYVIRQARMGNQEKQKYEVAEYKNVLTVQGRIDILQFLGSSSGVTLFAATFAVGGGYTPSVFPTDTSINGFIYGQTPSGFIVSGNTVDVSTFFGPVDANATWTNAGLIDSASNLVTHTRYAFTKTSNASISNDYMISQN